MKPGKATLDTMIAHILRFGTSKETDRKRTRALGTSEAETVQHRELRRAARRLAKMAVPMGEYMRRLHAEYTQQGAKLLQMEEKLTSLRQYVELLMDQNARTELRAARSEWFAYLFSKFEEGDIPKEGEALLGHRFVVSVRMPDGSLVRWSERGNWGKSSVGRPVEAVDMSTMEEAPQASQGDRG